MKKKNLINWFVISYIMAVALIVIGIILCGKNDMGNGPIVLACGVILFIKTTSEIRNLKK